MVKNLKMKIFGEVQGVGFRDAVYWIARKLYVAGFVMNEPDGSIYIEAGGEEETIEPVQNLTAQRKGKPGLAGQDPGIAACPSISSGW